MQRIMYRTIPGFSNYEVSEYGDIRNIKTGKDIAFIYNHAGYKVVTITDDSEYRAPRKVHQLVYVAFVGPIESGKVVDHIDDNKLNNHYSNLQLLTPSENSIKSFITGSNAGKVCWERDDVEKMCKMMSDGKTNEEIFNELGITDKARQNKCVHFLNSLVRKETHVDISWKYDFKNRISSMNKKDAKLNSSSVSDLYMSLLMGETPASMTRMYGITHSSVCKIRDKKTWVKVTDEIDKYFE